jgi:CRP/FNR family cyclic AMP-dependent transcriptional regulator
MRGVFGSAASMAASGGRAARLRYGAPSLATASKGEHSSLLAKPEQEGTRMAAPIPLFQGLPQESIDQLLSGGVRRTYPRNSVIINEGDEATSLYIVLSGRLKVYRADADGKEFILDTLSEGDHFGELALVDDEPRSASVATLEPCKLLVLSKAAFHESLARNPELAAHLIQWFAGKVRRLTDSAYVIATCDVFGRLRALLTERARPRGDLMAIEEHLTHQEIASRIGCTREMVSRIMRDLVTGGYIEIDTDHRILVRKQLPQSW